jgi:endonuclease/exonuclease/phosphatase family metal-dependent hydrolase
MRIFVALMVMTFVFVGCTPTGTPSDTSDEIDGTTVAIDDVTTKDADETTTAALDETTKTETEKTLRVATYNIKHCEDAKLNPRTIANVIKSLDLDIVGLQEVDYKTSRSNKVDQPMVLASMSGMKYYAFCRCIDFDGGEYGTLILSKYPIIKSEVTPLESSTHEARALGHAQINVDGEVIDFFNTHLSFEETSVRKGQLEAIANILKNHESFILTGDFNTADFAELAVLGGTLVNRSDRKFNTFPSEKVGGEIDNIVFSSTFAEKDAGTLSPSYSDHIPLWVELTIKK